MQTIADTPDWRWMRAAYELKRDRLLDTDYVPDSDIGVQVAKRYLRTFETPKLDITAIRRLMPAVSAIHDIYQEDSPSCVRHALEASILARLGNDDIRMHVHPDLSDLMIEMYCSLFFDVRERLDTPFWIERCVFTPADHSSGDLRNSKYFWKIVAYSDGKGFIEKCLSGCAYREDTIAKMREMVIAQDAKNTLKALHNRGRLPQEIEAPHTHRNAETWATDQKQAAQAAAADGQAGTAGKNEIAEEHTLKTFMKLAVPDEKRDGVEKLDPCTITYNDKEFKND